MKGWMGGEGKDGGREKGQRKVGRENKGEQRKMEGGKNVSGDGGMKY